MVLLNKIVDLDGRSYLQLSMSDVRNVHVRVFDICPSTCLTFSFSSCLCLPKWVASISFSFGQMTYESEFVGKLVHRLANKLDQDHVVSNLKQVDQKSIKSHKSRGYCNNKTHHLAWMTKYILNIGGHTLGSLNPLVSVKSKFRLRGRKRW